MLVYMLDNEKKSYMHKKASKKYFTHLLESTFAGLGAFVSLSFIGLLAQTANTLMIIAPFGATAVLLFSAPKSQFSKPLNIFGGYVVSTIVGLLVLRYSNGGWLIVGMGIGFTIMLMQLFNVVHPPAGANFFVVSQGHIPLYLFEPLFIGLLTLIIIAMSFDKIKNKLNQRRN